jgi:hypothetical protein
MWRAAYPREALESNPRVKEFFKLQPGNEPIVRTWLGPSTYALTLSREDVMVWIMNHDVTGSEKESWNNTIDKQEVLDGMETMPGMEKVKWAPIFRELVETTPDNTIVNFELLWRNPQPSWTSPGARVIQIGDAAHSYLPASGNGATQAIEDAISIASCLQIGGKENIPQSVRVHIRFRLVLFITIHVCYIHTTQLHPQFLRPKARLLQRRTPPGHRLGQSQARPAPRRTQAPQMGVVARPRSLRLRKLRSERRELEEGRRHGRRDCVRAQLPQGLQV